MRKTTIVHGRLAMRYARLEVARNGANGSQVLAIEHAAARLAGGFIKVVDGATVRETVTAVIPELDLGELEPIKDLPGFPRAAAASLMKLWMSGIDISSLPDHPRIAAIQTLDAAVRDKLPSSVRPPNEVVDLALKRVKNAPKIFGTINVEGMTELHPIWRNLLLGIADHQTVIWESGPRTPPDWVQHPKITITRKNAEAPRVTAVSCSSSRHEVIEALRWARSLMVLGIPASDIAIATTSTRDYDDHFATLSVDAAFPVHFVHGLTAAQTVEGQAAAALADVLLRGISQKRVRRLISLVAGSAPALSGLDHAWASILPPDAALTTLDRWKKAFERRDSGKQTAVILMPVLTLIEKGPEAAAEAGELLLSGRSLAVWRRALVDGPPNALDQTIETLRVDDEHDPFSSVAYMAAESLATCPRKHVRLIGLTSRAWPRGISEDALIPSHVIATRDLDPLPLEEADRRDFETILSTTQSSVVLSWARRDAEGRVLGVSSLVPDDLSAKALRLVRDRCPHHAMSEADRLLARPDEFAADLRAESAAVCWHNWQVQEVTPNDGLIRADHPRIDAAFRLFHSTTSLKALLRDPIGFTWQYALGFRASEFDDEPLTLDARHFGNILHDVLRRTVESLERDGGMVNMSKDRIVKAIEFAAYDAGVQFQITQPVPAALIWHVTMANIVDMAKSALLHEIEAMPGQVSYTEVPFGGGSERTYGNAPWNTDQTVKVPGTDIKIRGYIDRLDLSGSNDRARVMDYKSGKVPKDVESIILAGGSELQRCLYGFAVRALLGENISIESGLLYPRGDAYAPLPDADDVLEKLAEYIAEAVAGLKAGKSLPGIDTESRYNDLRFALPANAGATYLRHKNLVFTEALGEVTKIWEAV